MRRLTYNPEQDYIDKIDREREEEKREQLVSSIKTANIIEDAKRTVRSFFRQKLSSVNTSEQTNLEISSDELIKALGLANIDPAISESQLDKIVIFPGIEKTEKGYKVTSPETVLNKKIAARKERILKLFLEHPEGEYSFRDIETELGLNKYTASELTTQLLDEGRIKIRRWEKFNPHAQQSPVFKLSKTKKNLRYLDGQATRKSQ